jgi:arylsulfatase A-like enzyme
MIAAVLKENGYYTVGITGGAQVSSAKGFSRGFNRYAEFNLYKGDHTRSVFETAMNWLEENRDIKFFMFLQTYECHTPYEDERFLKQEAPVEYIEKKIALYDGDLRRTDEWFGKLMDKLESLDLFSDTIIVVVSDHGEDLHDHFTVEDVISDSSRYSDPTATESIRHRRSLRIHHGHSLYEEITRVLTIFHVPGLQPEKTVLENQVRLIDVMPTILDRLGIQTDDPVQGTSLLELMKTGERAHDPAAISEFVFYGPERKSVRMNGYKYIYAGDLDERRNDTTYRNIPQYALFDLKNDPDEKHNIYSQNKGLASEYHKILGESLEQSLSIKSELEKKYKPIGQETGEQPEDVLEDLKALGYLQ